MTDDALKALCKGRGTVKGRLTNFKKYIQKVYSIQDELTSQLQMEIKLRVQGATNLLQEFNDIQNKIDALIPDADLEQQLQMRESFESEYYSVLSQAKCKLGDENINIKATTSNVKSVKLPTISLPTFNGSYENWLEFRDTYLSLVHKSKDIPDIQKFHYLKSSLQGSAQLVIDALEFSSDNYNIAWEILMNRYNNSRLLVHNHVKSLFSIPAITKESPNSLRQLIDSILKNLRALKLLGQPTETWDTLVNYMVVSRLDSTTERAWELHKSSLLLNNEDDANFLVKTDDLLKFLRSRADVLETLSSSHNKGSPHASTNPKAEYKKSNSNTQSFSKLHCNVATNKPADKSSYRNTRGFSCIMCNAQHSIYSCQKFIDLTLQDKLKFIKEKSLCENCLRFGHALADCRFGPCRHCSKKHNSLVHRNTPDDNKLTASLHTLSEPVSTKYVCPSSSADNKIELSNACHTLHAKGTSLCHSNEHVSNMDPVLLSTAYVKVADKFGIYHKARAILDSGSERCFISKPLCKKLNATMIQSTQQIKGVGNSISKSTQTCNIEFKSTNDLFSAQVNCIVLPQITSTLPSATMVRNQFKIPHNIELADPKFFDSEPVDLLIGADLFWDLLDEGKMRLNNGPFLQNTKLGWIISGPITFNTRQTKYTHCNFTQSSDMDSLSDQLRLFWEIEELPRDRATRTDAERACEELFARNTTRNNEGQFIVSMPLKSSPDLLGDSFSKAEQRFLALEKRLQRAPAYKKLYAEFLHEYESLGHMTRVSSYGTPHYFLPHHGVFREHSTTTKLRVVFDASAATSSGKSLNDLQLIGPPLQGDLISILLRFRECRYVACADIEKMFRNILLVPEQRDLQLILWRENPSDLIQIYQLNTVTYGTASAPFLSCRCLKQLAQECKDPDVARTIREDFYVDDLIRGDNDMQNLMHICQETTKVLKSGCFNLRKWIFNFDAIESEDTINASKELCLGENMNNRTLGLGWFNKSDNLHYHTRYEPHENQPTKRIILSESSQIFDPLGLISPTIIIAKIILQKLWLLKVDWDDPIPADVGRLWNEFIKNLVVLKSLKIPRYVMCENPIRTELHIFTDASQVAYGACAYIRSIDSESTVKVQLLCSKGRVAPLTPTTIPRLELNGALIGARLYKKIVQSIRSRIHVAIFWTDSTIVLGWLHMSPNLLKTYVQNRVAEIHQLAGESPWRHVSGKENPADLVSRGLNLNALSSCNLWWNGPQFLYADFDAKIPEVMDSLPEIHDLPEVKATEVNIFISQSEDGSLFPFSRFSQFDRMRRAAAYMLRFINNTRNKHDRRSGVLSVTELQDSAETLARLSQRESFPFEYNSIINDKDLSKTRKFSGMNLFIDKNKILRIGGRIEYSPQFSFDKRHPILLSCKHHFAVLLFRYEHKKLMHAAPQLLLYTIRESWWPLGGRNLAKKTVHGCCICARIRGKTLTPIMGNLPKERLMPGYPFLRTGVDYAGPVFILNRKGRGAKLIKSYICLFICFVTRALHLELVSDLSSEAYLLALKRFISRRGKPVEIYSDNGKNFVGLMNDFRKFLSNCSDAVKDYVSSQNIKFHFIPPYASHFGGLWEAGVKTCKHHLRRVVGNAHLTFEEFTTVLTQVEAIVNSRPLTPMSTDPNDLLPLSPAHFLIGRPFTAPICADVKDVPVNRLTRWERVEQLRQHFWTRWSKEFISELQIRTKWKAKNKDLSPDTLVLLKEDNMPPLKWMMGRVVKTFPGRDGVARVADVRTANGVVRRAFSKVCPLPVDEEQRY